MEIIKFVKSLLPQFNKDRVTEDIRITETELTKFAIPSYLEAELGLKNHNFKSKDIQDFTTILKRNLKTASSDNIIVSIRKALEETAKGLKVIQGKAEAEFEDEVVVAGITVKKVNLIKLAEVYSFVVRYSIKFLNYLYILETAALNANNQYTRNSLSSGDIAWLQENYLNFCIALKIVSRGESGMEKTFDEIPDVMISSTEATLSTLGEDKVDPFLTRGLHGFSSSPIFHVRMIVAEYQVARYKEKKELKSILELRLLNLKKTIDGSGDAALEKEINYTQSRIDKLNEQLRKAEGAE